MTSTTDIPDLTRRSALFLDLDGTLLDIAERHDLVWVAPELPGVIARLESALGGAVAIVTGRPLSDVDRLLPLSGLAVAAEHGARLRLPDGYIAAHAANLPERDDWVDAVKAALHLWPGAFIEEKSVGFVVHYRQAPSFGSEIGQFLADLVAPAAGRAEILPALMAFEIRAEGVGKGHAVRHLMAESPFAGRVPVFIGDDVTDEEGMAAAEAMGGQGLHVHRVFGGEPAAVRAWLARMADGLEASQTA
ncbi:trehalose-phosphatase [Acidisoma cellulosilytica]|uniref:Trehalose 6-phosphate phosphatase n=1 Tax=Acidisoma cellulosilyticum TaxID=2802395 RepID=A0A963YZJ6_9PROT|nr:trehalose-phosphatase [Acidisoma cellulosilyticum]MCB8879821.1 trehalose-phosphatase [Acidisoma cellulosilyticum]